MAALTADPFAPSYVPQLMLKATFSLGMTVGEPTMAKAMATPVNAFRLSLVPSVRTPLRTNDPEVNPLTVTAAKLPEASVTTSAVGPDSAAVLAAEGRPGNV